MLVHRRSLPRNLSGFPNNLPAGTHLYTWEERGTVRVKCLAQEHNTMSLARARTRTARSGVERTNHEATAPPTFQKMTRKKYLVGSRSRLPNTKLFLNFFKVINHFKKPNKEDVHGSYLFRKIINFSQSQNDF